MSRHLPIWRSMLFVPATSARHVESARRRNPDAFQIDLEDSVPLERKAEARAAVPTVARQLAGRGADVVVRINRPFRLALPDVEAAIGSDVDALNLPKVPDAAYVRAIAEIAGELERERGLAQGHTRLLAMIETAEGLANMAEIARASERLVAITIGAEDLSLDLGMEPEADGLYMPNMDLVAKARAAGILPIGYLGSVAQFADRAAFRAVVRRSRALGFEGGFCIHPNQIDILNEEFSPTADQLALALKLVDAYDEALRQGRGAVTFNNKMIDQPVADRARALIAKGEMISLKERLKVIAGASG
ncbi:CoA ester lyase [Rhizobium sp. BK251]|uniref:HpcH/HpaI aldolase/citrate lyase family protein n=1 Tax=Rhizobium sp. BK251 TaxID=2512125 RepID=UPI00104B62C1|nr:CoA ester lyase [Rhizobium sp. BK251]TCL66434.1 citrate lyase subunit beta/citryl-CoA lyase [Rhizobium sp. BK251]